MEGFMGFLGVVILIFGILQIILFFKVWGMTNNVMKIRRRYVKDEDVDNLIRRAYYKGDIYTVQDLLTEQLLDAVFGYMLDSMDARYNYVSIRKDKVDEAIIAFKPLFDRFGLEVPENILKLRENPTDILA